MEIASKYDLDELKLKINNHIKSLSTEKFMEIKEKFILEKKDLKYFKKELFSNYFCTHKRRTLKFKIENYSIVNFESNDEEENEFNYVTSKIKSLIKSEKCEISNIENKDLKNLIVSNDISKDNNPPSFINHLNLNKNNKSAITATYGSILSSDIKTHDNLDKNIVNNLIQSGYNEVIFCMECNKLIN